MTVTHVAVMILAQCLIRSWASPLVYFNSLSSLPFGSGIHFSTSSLNRSTKWLYSNEFPSKHSNSTFGAACFLIIFISRHSLQRGQNPSVINNPAPPPIIGYPRIFRFFLTPPPPITPPPSSRYLSISLVVSNYITSICIKACYDCMLKAIRECFL